MRKIGQLVSYLNYYGAIGNVFNFTPLEGYFSVGRSGWYGVANAYLDDLKIYNYAKNDYEILQDYQGYIGACATNSQCGSNGFIGGNVCQGNNVYGNYITFTCNNAGTINSYCSNSTSQQLETICPNGCTNGFCNLNFSKPVSTGSIKVVGRNLVAGGQNYTIKSLGYAPTPIGSTPDWGYDVTVHPELRARDFPLIRTMNANTIRTWGKVGQGSFLDDAWNNGTKPIRVIMGYWMGNYQDYTNATVRSAIKADFSNYVNAYKNYPAVLIWAIGNEENKFYANNDNAKLTAYFSLVNEMAQVAYQDEGSNYHPVLAVCLEMPGEMKTVGNAAGGADDASMPYVDMWGINHYPGASFGSFFDTYKTKTAKPLIVTEYGIDAYDNQTGTEYESTQAAWDASLWNQIIGGGAVGGSLMEYSDEWFKDYTGNVNTHDTGGYPTTSHPDSASNEEYWGIMRISKNASGVDTMTPRQVYYTLQSAFGNISSDYPWVLDLNMPTYTKNLTYYSGAATAAMILNYQRNGRGLGPLSQSAIYANGSVCGTLGGAGTDFNANGMQCALQNLDPYDTPEMTASQRTYSGYNYMVENYTDINFYMRDILHWMAWNVPVKNWWLGGNLTATPNTPAAIPLYGSYSHWVAVNGGVADQNPCPANSSLPFNSLTNSPYITPANLTVYGFYLTDPAIGGMGNQVYVTAQAANATYFMPVVSTDGYNGQYVQVAEPSQKDDTKIRLADLILNEDTSNLQDVVSDDDAVQQIDPDSAPDYYFMMKEKSPLKAKSLARVAQYNRINWNNVIDGHLLTDKSFMLAFKGTSAGMPLKVKRTDINQTYFIVPFGKKKGYAQVIIIVDDKKGAFKQATWVTSPEQFPSVGMAKALKLAQLKNKEVISMQLEWDPNGFSSSPFLPYWEIKTKTENVYVNQAGQMLKN